MDLCVERLLVDFCVALKDELRSIEVLYVWRVRDLLTLGLNVHSIVCSLAIENRSWVYFAFCLIMAARSYNLSWIG